MAPWYLAKLNAKLYSGSLSKFHCVAHGLDPGVVNGGSADADGDGAADYTLTLTDVHTIDSATDLIL